MVENQIGMRNFAKASNMFFSSQTSYEKFNILDSTSSCENLSNSWKTLYLVGIRRLVKRTVWSDLVENQIGMRNFSKASNMFLSTETSYEKFNFLDLTSSGENFSNSSKTLYLVEIRRLLKLTVKQHWLQLGSFVEFYQIWQIVIKWSFRFREENKSVSWLIGGVLQKIWQCLQFEQLSLIRLKSVSMVRIGWKLNRCVKLSQTFSYVLFHGNIIKHIEFRRSQLNPE